VNFTDIERYMEIVKRILFVFLDTALFCSDYKPQANKEADAITLLKFSRTGDDTAIPTEKYMKYQ
jgi:hypothetical protein